MGIIKEPKGVDFYVINRPLSTDERKEISDFIKNDKANFQKRLLRQKNNQKA